MFNLTTGFIGRDKELRRLEIAYASEGFRFVTLSGDKKSGKTSLMREFCKNKRTMAFTVEGSDNSRNLSSFSKAVSKSLYKGLRSLVEFSSFKDAFDFIAKLSERGRIVLVIDESGCDSRNLALEFERYSKKTTNILLVSVVSSFTPINQRNNEIIELKNLSFKETIQFSNYSDEDNLLLYGFTGGSPSKLSRLDPSISIKENIDRTMFSPDGALYEDPLNHTRIRNPDMYNRILTVLGVEMKKMGDIVEETGMGSAASCSSYLSSLEKEGVVERMMPFGDTGTRRSIYRILDPADRFWYGFVADSRSLIDYRFESNLFSILATDTDTFLHGVFRDVCCQFIKENGKYLEFDSLDIGMWWGTDAKRSMGRIDIISESKDGSEILFCDCKFKSISSASLDGLISKSYNIKTNRKRRYVMFSKEDFSNDVEAYAEKIGVMLISLKNIVDF